MGNKISDNKVPHPVIRVPMNKTRKNMYVSKPTHCNNASWVMDNVDFHHDDDVGGGCVEEEEEEDGNSNGVGLRCDRVY